MCEQQNPQPTPRITVIVADSPGLATAAFDILAVPSEPKYRDEPVLHKVKITDLIRQVVRGLEAVQRHDPLKSRAQAIAITKLEEATHWLDARPEGRR